MTKGTRVFLFVSAGILVLGLGTGLVASYMGGFQNLVLIGSDGPDELAYVPADAQMVAYADVRAIANSNVRRKMRERSGDNKTRANDFEARTGIDVERDVDHVLASSGGPSGAGKGQPPLVLARGRFDATRIESAMREQGAAPEDYRGTRVIAQSSSSHPFAMAFVEPDLLAFGPVDAVRHAIDVKVARRGSVKENADVMRLVKDVKSGDAWAVARFDAIAGRAPIPADLAARLPAITWFSASGNVDDGIRGTIHAEARDDMAAKNLSDVIRGFMALARMQAGNQAGFGAAIDSLQLSSEGKTVTLAFSVPAEMLDQLATMRARHAAQNGAPAAPSRTVPRPQPGQ
jgi:hypothetical protein